MWFPSTEDPAGMEGDDFPREDIARLEARIEALARTIERCGEIILAAKIAIAAGGVLLLALVLGAIGFHPTALIGAMAAVIGGIVAFGSNASTAKQATADLEAAEAERAALIGRIDLRVVDAPEL